MVIVKVNRIFFLYYGNFVRKYLDCVIIVYFYSWLIVDWWICVCWDRFSFYIRVNSGNVLCLVRNSYFWFRCRIWLIWLVIISSSVMVLMRFFCFGDQVSSCCSWVFIWIVCELLCVVLFIVIVVYFFVLVFVWGFFFL